MPTLPDNDMDRHDAINGPDMPECIDCGEPTTREDLTGIPRCPTCAEKREQDIWEEQQMARMGR